MRRPANLGGGGGQGSVAKLQEVLELTMWFPVGQTPGSSAGRAVQAQWTLRPALQSRCVFLHARGLAGPVTELRESLATLARVLQGLWSQRGTSLLPPQIWWLSQGLPLVASAHCLRVTCWSELAVSKGCSPGPGLSAFPGIKFSPVLAQSWELGAGVFPVLQMSTLRLARY